MRFAYCTRCGKPENVLNGRLVGTGIVPKGKPQFFAGDEMRFAYCTLRCGKAIGGWADVIITNCIYAISAIRGMIDALQHCHQTLELPSIYQCH
jgi:hypothetical protein